METPTQMAARLVTALEVIARDEAACLGVRDFAGVAHLRERADPLVRHLAEHGPAVADAALRARIAAFLGRHRETGDWLAGQIERTAEQLRDVEAARRRVTRVAPAYGRGDGVPRRLCAVG